MNADSLSMFHHLPPEIQYEIWDLAVGPPRIHVFRPGPVSIFHWAQDYACPIHQVLDAATNRPRQEGPLPLLNLIWSCGGAYDWLRLRLVQADLSRFKPVGSRIPSTHLDVHRVRWAEVTLRHIVNIFKNLGKFANTVELALRDSRQIIRYEKFLIRLGEFSALFGVILENLPGRPDSVFNSIAKYIDAIDSIIKSFILGLKSYKEVFQVVNKEKELRLVLRDEWTDLSDYLERANRALAGFAVPAPLDWLLSGADVFKRDETQRAMQRFVVAPHQDLVYVADPLHPELFVQLWKSTWCEKVQRLAILICDCSTGVEWYEADLPDKAGELWPNGPSLFENTELKEIMLVVKPRAGCECSLSLPRDTYGFVGYEVAGLCSCMFSSTDQCFVEDMFEAYEGQLESMFPRDLGRKIKISRVVDIDCESVGLTNVEGENSTYQRSRRN